MAKFNPFKLMQLFQEIAEVINDDDNHEASAQEVSAIADAVMSGLQDQGVKVSSKAETAVSAIKMLSGSFL